MALLLGLVVVVGLAPRARLSPVGLPYSYHWDEPATLNHAVDIVKSGDWNPHFFNYGSLSIYLTVATVQATYAYAHNLPSEHMDHIGSWSELEAGQPDFEWYISHPRFLQNSRWVTIFFGLASCLTLLGLGSAYDKPLAGGVAAILLATSRFHVEMSSLLTPNVPASACALLALCSAALALRRDSVRLLPWLVAGVLCGLAGSFKYNFAVVSVVIFAAMLLSRLPSRTKVLASAALPLTVIAAFLLGTPYAVLDFPGFLEGVNYELNHYLVEASDIGTVEPGLGHLWLDLSLISKDFSLPILLLAGLGAWILARTVKGAWVLPVGAGLVLTLTATTSVGFHRNVVLAYPIIAFCVAMGGEALAQKFTLTATPTRQALVFAGVAALVVFRLTVVYDWLDTVLRPDPRVVAIDEVNALGEDIEHLVVAEELRLHPLELDRLTLAVTTKPLEQLLCGAFSEGTVYLLPNTLASDRQPDAARVTALNRALKTSRDGVSADPRDGPTQLHRLSFWPGVALVTGDSAARTDHPFCADAIKTARDQPSPQGDAGAA